MVHIIRALAFLAVFLPAIELGNATINYTISPEEIVLSKYDKDLLTNVHVTMYYPVEGQTDSTPDIVADGTKFDIPTASKLKWIAVSRDLHDRWGGDLQFGDIVYLNIPGSGKTGYYRVKDTMNRRWEKRVDILESPGHPLYRFEQVDLYRVIPKKMTSDQLWANHLAP